MLKYLFIYSALVSFLLAADCGESCPFGNNSCTNEKCSRCFPLFPNNWSEGKCRTGAGCFERCDADTDCDRDSDCKYCVSGRCALGTCATKCTIDQECQHGCPYCDPKEDECSTSYTCPAAFSETFSGADSCSTNTNWYLFEACSSDCQSVMSSAQCKHSGNTVTITTQPCVENCVCFGAQADTCYSKTAPNAGFRMQTGHHYCHGMYTWTLHAAHDSKNQTVAGSQDILEIHSNVTAGFSSAMMILRPSTTQPESWIASIQVADGSGKVCHSEDVPVATPLATLDSRFAIEYNPADIDFYVGGRPIHKFTFTTDCPHLPLPVFASYASVPASSFKGLYASDLTDFTYVPLK